MNLFFPLFLLSVSSLVAATSSNTEHRETFSLMDRSGNANHDGFLVVYYPAPDGVYFIDVEPCASLVLVPRSYEVTYSRDGHSWSKSQRIGPKIYGGLPNYLLFSSRISGKTEGASGLSIPVKDLAALFSEEMKESGSQDKLYIKLLIHLFQLDLTSGELTRFPVPSELLLMSKDNTRNGMANYIITSSVLTPTPSRESQAENP